MVYWKKREGHRWSQNASAAALACIEIALLKENPYTHEVRARQISFTAEFKRIFWARYQAGEYIPAIFESLGYDQEILGIARMYSLASNLRKCVAEGREFTSGYTNRAKSHKRAEKMPAPDTSAMQHELTYLRQQVEFLKKLPNWAEGHSGGADGGQAGQEVRVDP